MRALEGCPITPSPFATVTPVIRSPTRTRGAWLAATLLAIALEACGGGSSLTEEGCGGNARASGAGSDALAQVVVGLPGDTTATLQWVAPNDERVRGYRIYHGTSSRLYYQPKGYGLDIGNVTTYQAKYLEPGAIHYFAVTAYASDSCESDYSNEAAKAILLR